ncbi:MAG: terminase small subunit [Steroidobacteraceae bacterium]
MENYFKLGARLQRFVDAIAEGCTGAEAVRRVRPKQRCPKQTAYSWRKNPRVAAAIEERKAEAIEDAGVNLVRLLQELARVAYFNPKRLLGPDGNFLPLHEWPDDAAAAIAGLDIEEIWTGVGEERKLIGRVLKPRAAPKVEAARLLGQHLKAFTEKHEHTGKDGEALPAAQQTVYVIQKSEAEEIRKDLNERV